MAPAVAGNWGSMACTWGSDGAALVIPPRLRRFVLAEWVNAGEESLSERVPAARAAYTTARRRWAEEHGFDVHAVNGTHPGADWWAFIALCAEQQRTDESCLDDELVEATGPTGGSGTGR